jgi:hypothetical protein
MPRTRVDTDPDSTLIFNPSDDLSELLKCTPNNRSRSRLDQSTTQLKHETRYALPLTMFSITVTTFSVALCALLRLSAMNAMDSSIVHAPTVEPGLH